MSDLFLVYDFDRVSDVLGVSEPRVRMRSMNLTITKLAESQHGVVSRAQLLELGFPASAIDHHRTKWTTLHAGVYALPGSPDTYGRRVMAATLAAGGLAAASHATAVHLLKLDDEPHEEPTEVHISVPRAQRPDPLAGVIVHRPTLLLPEHLTHVGAIRVTNANRTICDYADGASFDDLELVADNALRRRVAHPAKIREILDRLPRLRGRATILAILDARSDGKPRVQRRLEQKLHRLLEAAGIAGWVPQYEVRAQGREHRIDVAFPAQKLGLETAGYAYHSSRSAWDRDQKRNARLVAEGWRFLTITWDDVTLRAAATIASIQSALGASPRVAAS